MRVGSSMLSFPFVLLLCAAQATQVRSFVAPRITRVAPWGATELQMDQSLFDSAAQQLSTNDLALWHVDGRDFTLLESARSFLMSRVQEGGAPTMGLLVALCDSIPLFPTQPISIASGALFGFGPGLAAVIVGQTLAAAFALSIGRYAGPSVMDALDNSSKARRVLEGLGLDADAGFFKVFRAIFIARQSPVLPFSVGNYLVGAATSAPIVPALLGTLLGCVPLNCVWVGVGAGGMTTLNTLEGDNGSISQYMGMLEGVGAIATLLIVLNLGKVILDVSREGSEVKETN